MACDTQSGEGVWELVDDCEEELEDDDGVDEAREGALGEDGVLFDKLGEVVQPASDGEGEEEEAADQAEVALRRAVSILRWVS